MKPHSDIPVVLSFSRVLFFTLSYHSSSTLHSVTHPSALTSFLSLLSRPLAYPPPYRVSLSSSFLSSTGHWTYTLAFELNPRSLHLPSVFLATILCTHDVLQLPLRHLVHSNPPDITALSPCPVSKSVRIQIKKQVVYINHRSTSGSPLAHPLIQFLRSLRFRRPLHFPLLRRTHPGHPSEQGCPFAQLQGLTGPRDSL